jgi:hypothetical protein
MWKPGIGTAMEMVYAHTSLKPILVLKRNEIISPWVNHHATDIIDIDNKEAIKKWIKNYM